MSKAVLITGASTGIGLDAAKTLGEKGWQVLAGVRKDEDLQRLNELPGVEGIRLDVTNADHLVALEKRLAELGHLDALINNAGIAVGGPWELIPLEDVRHQFEVNVFGVVATTQKALPYIRKSAGRVVNVSSISGRVAGAFLGPYAASKFALEAFTDSLRRELGKFGVKVASINPGPIDTPIWSKGMISGGDRDRMLQNNDQRKAYGRTLDKFVERIGQAAKGAAPVSQVTDAIEDALTATRPRSRYYIGKGIWFAAFISKALPDSVLDPIVRRTGG